MTTSIHLGFEVGSGNAVEIPLRHTAVTGQTQESGKTTTLEGLISRSGLRAVAYVTKRGESSFHVMHPIQPYFQERADWKFVQSLLEASTETKLDFKQSWIMRASEGARTLQDVRGNIKEFIHGVRDTRPIKQRKGAEAKERWLLKPARGLSEDMYYVLDKYLDDIMPQLATMPYSTNLALAPGLNVMDLREYEFPLQALVVRSVIDWVHDHGANTINVIPEAWKFAPKQKGSPVRQSAEEMIREGGALKNFLWIDSQDLAGVADVLMRQVGVWIFGVQRAKHEIERALDHMPEGLPVKRARPQDIATLSKGQFFVCFGREMYKVYVQPAWMTAAHAEAIARGEEDVDSAREILKEFDKESKHDARDLASVASAQVGKRNAENLPSDETVPMSRLQRRQDSQIEGNSSASDCSSQRGDDSAGAASQEEEAMWKEKYEELKLEFDQLREAHDALAAKLATMSSLEEAVPPGKAGAARAAGEADTRLAAASAADNIAREAPLARDARAIHVGVNGAPSLHDIYVYVRERAAKDPGILQLLREQPELRIKLERKTIDADAETLRGRLAVLLSKKFFDAPQNGNTAFNELKRLGFPCAKPNVYRELDKLAELGFVTKEAAGYQAVPGMKVNIVEAS